MLFVAWIFDCIFHCCRRVDRFLFKHPEPVEHIPVSSLPWLWIGAQFEDKVVDCTDMVNTSLISGAVVDKCWLQDITNLTPISWKYLDAKSLEEKEFSVEGFVIDDSGSNDPSEGNSGNANADHTE